MDYPTIREVHISCSNQLMSLALRIIHLFIIILFLSIQLSALQIQSDDNSRRERIDDFKAMLDTIQDKKSRMQLYNEVGKSYSLSDPDSSILYFTKMLPLAEELNVMELVAFGHSSCGYANLRKGAFGSALTAYNKVIEVVESPRYIKFIMPNGTKEERLEHQQRWMAAMNKNIGEIHERIGNRQKALNSYMSALEVFEQLKDTINMGWTYQFLASYFHYDDQIEQSILYGDKCIDALSQTNNDLWLASTVTLQGLNYLKLKNYNEARKYLDEGIAMSKSEYNQYALGTGLITLAELNLELQDLEKSYTYALEGHSISKGLDHALGSYMSSQVLVNSSAVLAEIHRRKGALDSADYYMQLYAALNETMNANHLKSLSNFQNVLSAENERLQALEKEKLTFRNNLKLALLLAGLGIVGLLAWIFNRNAKKERKTNDQITKAYDELKATQTQLIHSEKMASLGELTAGIAHEIQNPLNFVNNFSEVSGELIDEALEEIDNDPAEAKDILNDLKGNLERINHHGGRASSIVKGMLAHSREGSDEKVPTDINALCDEYIRLSYHGLRAKDKTFNAEFELDLDEHLPKIDVVPQDIGRVLLNIINNAFYACTERLVLSEVEGGQSACAERGRSACTERGRSAVNNTKLAGSPLGAGGEKGQIQPLTPNGEQQTVERYNPLVTLKTEVISSLDGMDGLSPRGEKAEAEKGVTITITDNGTGMSQATIDKIFQPFFTTKPTGEGTGLGMSISYDIVTKGHGGTIKVKSELGQGTSFIISLPYRKETTSINSD